jgi:hypothetical protein
MTKVASVPADVIPALFDKLTPMEQAFILHPQVMTNPQQAARDVGYSETTARTKASYMRKQLFYYIQPIHDWRMLDANLDQKRIIEELNAIAFCNEADFYDTVDVEGDTIKVLKDFTRLPEMMQRAIKTIELDTVIVPSTNADGESTTISYQVVKKLQLHDKQAALKTLVDISGMADPRFRKPAEGASVDEQELLQYVPADELELMNRIYSKAQKALEAAKKPIDVSPPPAKRVK